MRCVIGRYHIDRAVRQRGDERLTVSLLAERRIHAGISAVGGYIILGQRQVMRRDLGVNVCAQHLARSNERDRLRGRNVLEQHPCAGIERERNVAADHRGFRAGHRAGHAEVLSGFRAVVHARRRHERGLLLVEREQRAALGGLDHGGAAQRRTRQVDAIVSQARCARFEQCIKVGQLLPFQSLGDRARL